MSDETPDHQLYAQAKAILQRVFEIPPAERGAYLESACGNQPELRAEVFSLLAAHEQVSKQFLDNPFTLRDGEIATGADADDRDLSGQRVGAYRLERLLGRGGMGAVYLASRDDGEFKKHVAIKFIRTSAATPTLLRRFKAERQILADIDHPNIARLIDGGTTEGGMPFFIMEYVPGETLTHVLDRGPLEMPAVLSLATAVADVLEAVHSKGLVFRDLKPSNIMLTEQSGVKVLDFGIAKITRDESGEHSTTMTESGWIVGSPRYMSPEQATGEAVDARSDVFSFGVVIFEALTGKLPFKGDSRQEYFRSLITAIHEPLPTAIPDGLRSILERCLKKNPADRYANGKELAQAVRELIAKLQGGKSTTRTVLTAVALLIAVVSLGLWAANRSTATDSALLTGPPGLVATGLSDETNPRISPDSRWLSFLSDKDGPVKIFLRDQSSGNERTIASSGGSPFSYEWSPSSDRIAYAVQSAGQIAVTITPIDGGKTQTFRLRHSIASIVRWIGNGIYYLANRSLWRLDLQSGESREVTTARGTTNLREVEVSADERHIVYSSFKDSMSSLFYSAIDASNPVRLTNVRMDPRNLRFRDAQARQLLYTSEEGGMVDIWQVDVISGKRQRLTMSDTPEDGLDVSRDGSLLVYGQVREEAHLATLDPFDQTPTLKRVTSDRLADLMPSVSTSGQVIAFQRAKTTDMGLGLQSATIQVSRDGLATPAVKLTDGHAAEVSPDGRWVASSVWKPTGMANLHVTNLDTKRSVLVSELAERISYSRYPAERVATNMVWSPVEARLFYLSREAPSVRTEVWSAKPSADGTQVERHQVTKLDDESATVTDVHVSVDGTLLSYLVRSEARGLTELLGLVLTRKEGREGKADKVYFSESSNVRLSSVGFTAEDNAPVIIRHDSAAGRMDVVWVKASGQKEVVRGLQDVNLSSFALDPRRRVLYFTRQRGNLQSLHALALDSGLERPVYSGPPFSPFLSAMRVMDDGRLLFSLQSQDGDIVTHHYGR